MSLEIIQRYNIFAKKSLGQNFLVDEKKVEEISRVFLINGENIVEVGPGYGALTEKLLSQKPQSLHLVELDRDMIDILEDRKNRGEFTTENIDFKIHNQDILKFTPAFKNYSVIANIPYYITSPILYHFLYELENTPKKMLILMQKDVGDKILSGSTPSPFGDFPLHKGKNLKKKSSVLSLMIAKKCYVTEKLFVPKESFIPAPKVESSVLLFETHEKYSEIHDEKFLNFIKIGFAQPRKKLIKNLQIGGYNMSKIKNFLCLQGYDENFRGEDGDIDFWIKFYHFLILDN